MNAYVDGLLKAAQTDLGYQEQVGGYTKFGDWYYTNVNGTDPAFKTAPWCDMFITWAGHQAGIKDKVGEFAYTVDHAKWFQEHGAWSEEPEPGALVFYDWSGSKTVDGIDHVGIVEKIEGDKIETIEGNVDGVWLKRKERDQSKVVGYGLPRKVHEAETVAVAASTPLDAVKSTVSAPDNGPAIWQALQTASHLPIGSFSASEFAVSGVLMAMLCALVLLRRANGRALPFAELYGRYRKWIRPGHVDEDVTRRQGQNG